MGFVLGGHENVLELVIMEKIPVAIIKHVGLYTLWERRWGGWAGENNWGNIGTTVIEQQ